QRARVVAGADGRTDSIAATHVVLIERAETRDGREMQVAIEWVPVDLRPDHGRHREREPAAIAVAGAACRQSVEADGGTSADEQARRHEVPELEDADEHPALDRTHRVAIPRVAKTHSGRPEQPA